MSSRRARVTWGQPPGEAAPTTTRALPQRARAVRPSAVDRAILETGVPSVADAQTPKEDALGLLQLAAEVEHALLVQYLYAAASLEPSAGNDTRLAHNTFITVAVQEMGHLVAVQNLLLAIGGVDAHHLGRDGLRAASDR